MNLTKEKFDLVMSKYDNISKLELDFPTLIKCKNSGSEFSLKDIFVREGQIYWKESVGLWV